MCGEKGLRHEHPKAIVKSWMFSKGWETSSSAETKQRGMCAQQAWEYLPTLVLRISAFEKLQYFAESNFKEGCGKTEEDNSPLRHLNINQHRSLSSYSRLTRRVLVILTPKLHHCHRKNTWTSAVLPPDSWTLTAVRRLPPCSHAQKLASPNLKSHPPKVSSIYSHFPPLNHLDKHRKDMVNYSPKESPSHHRTSPSLPHFIIRNHLYPSLNPPKLGESSQLFH